MESGASSGRGLMAKDSHYASAETCECACNGLCAFRVLDTIALVGVVGLQGAAFNAFFLDFHAGQGGGGSSSSSSDTSSRWYLLYAADALVMVAVIAASVLSYRRLLSRLHARLAPIDIPHLDVPMYGVLPFGYVTWALYAILLTVKIGLFFETGVALSLPRDPSERGLLSSSAFKVIVAAASVVFVLLVNTHHDAEPESVRSAYIADLCKGTTFDIMDTVAFLSILLPEYGLPAEYHRPPLDDAIVILACINLFLPTLALAKLSLSDFGQAGQPVRLELLYKTGRLFLIDLPYMIVRIYLWQVDRSVSLFLLKNVLYVLVSLRYLLPEYVAVAKSRRRRRVSHSPTHSQQPPLSPTAPPPPHPVEAAAN